MTAIIRVLVADTQRLIRLGVRASLSDVSDVLVVGEAMDTHEVEPLCRATKPHVVLLDLGLRGCPCMELVPLLRSAHPNVQVLVLATFTTCAYVRNLLAIGIAGYMHKDDVPDDIGRAVRHVAAGNLWLRPELLAEVVQPAAGSTGLVYGSSLSAKDLTLVQLIVAGTTSKAIGSLLGVTEKAVEKQLTNLYAKLGVASRVQVTALAVRLGLA